jgi:hypothetical protein
MAVVLTPYFDAPAKYVDVSPYLIFKSDKEATPQ